MRDWESIGAAVYYCLGITYYFYEWLIGVGIGGGVLSIFLRHRAVYFVLALGLSTLLLLAGFVAWLIKTKKRLHFINPDLAILDLVDTYEVTGAGKYAFEKCMAVRALRSNVNSFNSKFRWTGKGTIQASIEPAIDFAVSITNSPDDWDVMRVQFSKPLKRGQKTTQFKVRLEMTDTGGSARPFSQKFVDDFYPKGFTMRALLPSQANRLTKEIFLSMREELPMWSQETKPKDGVREVKWRIRKPGMGRRYRLSWDL
jgi:hypothetical protein